MSSLKKKKESEYDQNESEYDLDFEVPDQNPNGIIAKLCGKKTIPGANERSEMARILYPCRDTRDMMKISATLSDDGNSIVVEEPSTPAFMMADHESSDLFCKQMGFNDENEQQDWGAWAFGLNTNHPTKKTIYHLPMKCTLDFNSSMQNYKLKPHFKFSIHMVPSSRTEEREERTPIVMWCLGIDGTRESFAPTANDTHDDFFAQISEGVSNMGC
jgi:hypothetical protein